MSVTLIEGVNRLDAALTPVYVPPELATLYGVVTDSNTGYAIAGVLVEVITSGPGNGIGIKLSTHTDFNGNYEITDISLGTYDITFSHADYETLVI